MAGILGPVGDLLQSALQGLEMRKTVVAQNVANLETPGYKARDVHFQATLAQALRTGSVDPVMVDAPGAARNDGNTVNLESQLGLMNQVAMTEEGLMNAVQADLKAARAVIQDLSAPGV